MTWLDHVFGPFGIPIVAIVCFSLVGVVYAVTDHMRKSRRAEYEASLKAEMIKQGRSVEEIERILRATGDPEDPVRNAILGKQEAAAHR